MAFSIELNALLLYNSGMKAKEFVYGIDGERISEDTRVEVTMSFGRVALNHPNAHLLRGIQVWESRDAVPGEDALHFRFIEIIHKTSEMVVHLGNIRNESEDQEVPLRQSLDEFITLGLNEIGKPRKLLKAG